MSSLIAPSGSGSPGSGVHEPAGPSPAGVAGLVHERIVMLAVTYERTADELLALAAVLAGAQSPDIRRVSHGYRSVAAELRLGASGLSAQLGAVEQFLDLGALGASVLGVLAQAGQPVPHHGLAGLLR